MRNVSSGKIQSSFQKNFITKSTFKRNKRYMNLNQIKSIQNSRSATHRKPFTGKNSTSAKFKNSFLNTTGIFSDRPQHNNSPKQRKSLDFTLIQNQATVMFHQDNNRQEIYRPTTALQLKSAKFKNKYNMNAVRSVRMDRMTSRQYYLILKNKPCNDERLFNNFEFVKPKTSGARAFQKQLERNLDFSQDYITDLNYDSQKQYQHAVYDETTNKCQITYKLQDKNKGRFFFKTQRPQNKPATDLDFTKVLKSYQFANTTGVVPTTPFYSNSGRELPHQMQKRQMTPLKDHWHDKGEIIRPILDFGQRKLKKDVLEERMNNIKDRKKVKFDRQQLCDAKYFQVLGIRRDSRQNK